ncbi:flagellin FliC, partial [Thiomicrorhabdus sp. 6S2-11]|nr:flagellin FliC [Thiomicrorhabdus marina]
MAMVINTNMASLNAVRVLGTTSSEQSTSMERLTSGLRINSSADDAAGLAVTDRMNLQIRGTDQAIRNTNDGISVVQTIDGATEELANMLQRMRELGLQSMNETYSDENRGQMDLEFQQLKTEIDRVAETTKFNGTNVMNVDGGLSIQAGW